MSRNSTIKIMKKRILLIAINLIIIIGIWGSLGLVVDELKYHNICPKILLIPACYIIFICLLLAAIANNLNLKFASLLYFIGVITALSIATYGTLGEIIGFAECPKTTNGIPMCYISFAIFLSLLSLKVLSIRSSRSIG